MLLRVPPRAETARTEPTARMAAMEEMASSVQQNADNARQTDKIASKAANDALKAKTKIFRDIYDPLLANSVDKNFTGDPAAKAALDKL